MEKVKLKTNILKREITNIFKKFGLSYNHASISADALINAELVGAYGHGLSRLKMYCDRIKKKLINPKPKIKIKKISQSISHINANNSIGFVAADIGIKKAIENAEKIVSDARAASKHDLEQIETYISGMVSRKLKAAEDQITMAESAAVKKISHMSSEIAVEVASGYLVEDLSKANHDELIDSAISSLSKDLKGIFLL